METLEVISPGYITVFIAKQGSQQEFIPLVGEIIDRAHVDPLHLKNNACALARRYLLKLAVSTSNLNSISSFKQVPPNTPFFKYVETLRGKCKLNRLVKRIIRWYNDCGNCGKDFEYRFTGKDSHMFLYNFMFLVDLLKKMFRTNPRYFIFMLISAFACKMPFHYSVELT
jgi:hypothetical protein